MSLDTQPAALNAHGGIDPYAQFRVDSAREIAALMRQLVDTAARVHLWSPNGLAWTTVLWTVDSAQRRIFFSADGADPHLVALIEAEEAACVCYLDAVKLQFDLRDLMLVRGTQHSSLQAAMPAEVYRFQRRASYRVRTLERSSPTAHLRHPSLPDMALALRVLDVSMGGCALFVPDDVPPIAPGVELRGVRFELDVDTRFAASLMLHHVTSVQPGSRGVRLGCELVHMEGMAARALQRYIDQTQKRRRLFGSD
jgi:c-di-GMP-binding flagellar brake protein YcgR